jgi:hypothetical protein
MLRIMKPTTSADLAAMAARVPELTAGHGLRVIAALYTNVPDVILEESLELAIETAVLTGAPFISVDLDPFDAEAFEGTHHKYEGQCERLSLRWPAHGLTYGWSKTATWRERLDADIEKDELAAKHRATAESTKVDELAASLVDSPDFRQAQPGKRYMAGVAILANSGVDDDDITRQAVNRANYKVEKQIMQIELSLKPKMDDLAAELRLTPAWKAATSDTKRLNASIDFLIQKSHGYRLGTRIYDPLARLTKELEEKSAIQITVPQ